MHTKLRERAIIYNIINLADLMFAEHFRSGWWLASLVADYAPKSANNTMKRATPLCSPDELQQSTGCAKMYIPGMEQVCVVIVNFLLVDQLQAAQSTWATYNRIARSRSLDFRSLSILLFIDTGNLKPGFQGPHHNPRRGAFDAACRSDPCRQCRRAAVGVVATLTAKHNMSIG